MNRYLLVLSMAIASSAWADTPICIDVHTESSRIDYKVNNIRMTPDEIAKHFKRLISQFGDADPVLIRPSDYTTFKTVFTLLTLLKESGVKHFEVIHDAQIVDTTEKCRGLRLTPDNITLWQHPAPVTGGPFSIPVPKKL